MKAEIDERLQLPDTTHLMTLSQILHYFTSYPSLFESKARIACCDDPVAILRLTSRVKIHRDIRRYPQ